jgi:hypothetical protein
MYAGNTEATVLCVFQHILFSRVLHIYICLKVQVYSIIILPAVLRVRNLASLPECRKEAFIRDSGSKEEIWTQDGVSNDGCNPLRWKDIYFGINSLNTELNPICHLLALLGAHPILHVSRINVKLSKFRRKMLPPSSW